MSQNPEFTGDWKIPAGSVIKFKGIPVRLNEDITVHGNLSEIRPLGKGKAIRPDEEPDYFLN